MNRNVNSRFALNPTNIDMPRSRFVMGQDHKTTFNVGDIIPFYSCEVLPGDTFNVTTSMVVRMQTLITPLMDNVYLDTYYFFVPYRLVWEHWKEFMGENSQSAWLPQAEYSIPQIESPSGGWTSGTIADYMGIPIGVDNLSVSALPFRAYALCCDQWLRDENLTDPLNIPFNDSTQTGTNGGSYINDVANGGLPFVASKYFDAFTGALPAPQKGPDVTISLAEQPVVGNGLGLGLTDGTLIGTISNDSTHGIYSTKTDNLGKQNGAALVNTGSNLTNSIVYGVPTKTQLGSNLENSGLVTSGDGAIVTIAQLRQAFQIQKFYEKSARGGTRYIEMIKSMFGVTSPDARLQRTEYLGGKRIALNINQVVQTSQTDTTPMGDVAAYSLTSDVHEDFTQSFTEHGIVLGLMVARYDHTYQQGIQRFWSRKTRFDFYWPDFANLSEVGIRNSEIYAQGSGVVNPSTGNAYDDEIFGYQEAWYDYRYTPNRVSGEMRSAATTPLDMWHLGDDYNTLPSLSDTWIREDKSNLDRALAVTSAVSNQLFCDIFVKNVATRPMPVYSIPGLIDHH